MTNLGIDVTIARSIEIPGLEAVIQQANAEIYGGCLDIFTDVDLLQGLYHCESPAQADVVQGIFEDVLEAVDNTELGETRARRAELFNSGKLNLIIRDNIGEYLNRERQYLNAIVGNRHLHSGYNELRIACASLRTSSDWTHNDTARVIDSLAENFKTLPIHLGKLGVKGVIKNRKR